MRRHRRAEALFKKEQQLRDGQQAMARTPTRLRRLRGKPVDGADV